MSTHHPRNKDHLQYELTIRQEPKQARMCGIGGKADRRPIDPPPIIQLRVVDPVANSPRSSATSPASSHADLAGEGSSSMDADGDGSYGSDFLQNPYYFMFASLAKPDDDAELHWLKDGHTRCTTGSFVSSLYHLKDSEHQNEDAGFFVFPDLSVRTEGSYRLKLSLFEVVGNTVRFCRSIFSAPFYVYTAKKFPGMEESTPLSCSLADQGVKIRIRKDVRSRKDGLTNKRLMDGDPYEDDDGDDGEEEDEEEEVIVPPTKGKGSRGGARPGTRTKKAAAAPAKKAARKDSATNLRDANTGGDTRASKRAKTSSHDTTSPTTAPSQRLLASSWTSKPTPDGDSSGGDPNVRVIPPPPAPGTEVPPPEMLANYHSLAGPSVDDGRGGGAIPIPLPPPPPAALPPSHTIPLQGFEGDGGEYSHQSTPAPGPVAGAGAVGYGSMGQRTIPPPPGASVHPSLNGDGMHPQQPTPAPPPQQQQQQPLILSIPTASGQYGSYPPQSQSWTSSPQQQGGGYHYTTSPAQAQGPPPPPPQQQQQQPMYTSSASAASYINTTTQQPQHYQSHPSHQHQHPHQHQQHPSPSGSSYSVSPVPVTQPIPTNTTTTSAYGSGSGNTGTSPEGYYEYGQTYGSSPVVEYGRDSSHRGSYATSGSGGYSASGGYHHPQHGGYEYGYHASSTGTSSYPVQVPTTTATAPAGSGYSQQPSSSGWSTSEYSTQQPQSSKHTHGHSHHSINNHTNPYPPTHHPSSAERGRIELAPLRVHGGSYSSSSLGLGGLPSTAATTSSPLVLSPVQHLGPGGGGGGGGSYAVPRSYSLQHHHPHPSQQQQQPQQHMQQQSYGGAQQQQQHHVGRRGDFASGGKRKLEIRSIISGSGQGGR